MEIVVEKETTEIKELEEKYVVYFHKDDEGKVFYVGIGRPKRAFWFYERSEFWKRYVAKHCAAGVPRVDIIHQNISWSSACEHERFWIEAYGRRDNGTGCLVNMTDGGEGACGLVPSEETRLKMSLARKGKPFSDETRLKMSLARKGKSLSEEHREKLSQAKKGKRREPHSDETRLKISQANKGKPQAKKGKSLSDETRLKMSQANKGKTHSEEAKQKMKEAWKKYKNKQQQEVENTL